MAGEKNPLLQLRRLRDRAIFDILVMESGMPKTLIPFDHDKEAYSICVDLVWNKFRSIIPTKAEPLQQLSQDQEKCSN